MSVLHRRRPQPRSDSVAQAPSVVPAGSTSPGDRLVPGTRAGAAWIGISSAALTLVLLIVFMLQNTRSVEVTFLWMHGNVPLALALLVAAVGVAILFTVIGSARIAQLRRLSRRQR